MSRSSLLFALTLALATSAGHAAYRCESGGRVIYQEAPCAAPGGVRVEANPMNPTPEEAERAKQRAARDEAELKRIEKERAEAEKRRQAEEKAAQRKSKHKTPSSHCAKLARKAESLEKSLESKPTDTKLKDKAKRARENYEKDCT